MSFLDLFQIPRRLRKMEDDMSTLENALDRLVSELGNGFRTLHDHVDELHDQIAELQSDNAEELQEAASRIDRVVTDVERSFASFTQDPEVPVEPQPEPSPESPVVPGDETGNDDGPVVAPESDDNASER